MTYVTHRIKGIAKASEAMSEILLLPFTSPITPPATSSTMYIHRIVVSFIRGGRVPQDPSTSKLRISPGSHSATTSKGRQQTSQSVVKRCEAVLVSISNSNDCPQKGHWILSETCTPKE